MRKYFVVVVLCACSIATWPSSGHGQDPAPKVEVFLDGSKLWENAAVWHYHNPGLQLAITDNFGRFVGVETDLSEFWDSDREWPPISNAIPQEPALTAYTYTISRGEK